METNNYTYATVPTNFVEVNGIKFAYRSYGKEGDIPVICFSLRPQVVKIRPAFFLNA